MSHESTGYGSDLTDNEWQLIEALVVKQSAGPGRPMVLVMRAVINAILYVVRTGCQWRYLPHEDPNYNSV